jgi:deoxyadenosine/deoxycytidine kinase
MAATASVTALVLDGEIGAGKSEALGAIAESLRARGRRVIVVPEPVQEWEEAGILAAFYADPPRRAYEFQTYTFVTRVRALVEACEACDPPLGAGDCVVMERSPMTDRFVFMELQREMVGPMLMRMYERWWCEWMRLLPEVLRSARWVGVYLKPSIGSCMERLCARDRIGETVPEDYQRRLRAAHETFLQGTLLRKSALEDVLVLEGSVADNDFRSGEARERLGDLAAAFATVQS